MHFQRLYNSVCGNQVSNPETMFLLYSSLLSCPINIPTGVEREGKYTIISETLEIFSSLFSDYLKLSVYITKGLNHRIIRIMKLLFSDDEQNITFSLTGG